MVKFWQYNCLWVLVSVWGVFLKSKNNVFQEICGFLRTLLSKLAFFRSGPQKPEITFSKTQKRTTSLGRPEMVIFSSKHGKKITTPKMTLGFFKNPNLKGFKNPKTQKPTLPSLQKTRDLLKKTLRLKKP